VQCWSKEPLLETYGDHLAPETVLVVIIDTIDECDSDDDKPQEDRRAFLITLIQLFCLPKKFKIVVTGRDDRITESFRTKTRQVVLPTGSEVTSDSKASKDIRLSFERRFKELPAPLLNGQGHKSLMNLHHGPKVFSYGQKQSLIC